MSRPATLNLLIGACVASSIALLAFTGCHRAAVSTGAGQFVPGPQFVGSAACAPCHRSEFERQSGSRHAQTLRRATRESLGNLTPPIGPITGTTYTISEDTRGLYIYNGQSGTTPARLDFALGSGHSVMTFVGMREPNGIVEYRMTLDPHTKRWYITPGQEVREDLEVGAVHASGDALRCIRCHTDQVQTDSIMPSANSPGVRCESCHGPGGPHVARMQRAGANSQNTIVNPARSSAHEQNMQCAACHKSVDDLPLSGMDYIDTARFQPYAIEMSACYKKSGNKLSCANCHDPHEDASTDRNHYEQACLACHGTAHNPEVKSCPVNPTTGCIPCHMPKRNVLPGTNIPIGLTDHLIWAYRPRK